jgi:excinuclease ABC subunit A
MSYKNSPIAHHGSTIEVNNFLLEKNMNDFITVKGARLHNLKNVSLSIPKNKLVVFTGLSGSGKSTLAFDTLHKEGARQYMESLGLVTDALTKPPIDQIEGLSPSISVDQHRSNHSPRSTVGTSTEIFTYLRVLYARLGHRPCPSCGQDVPPSYSLGGDLLDEDSASENTGIACPACGHRLPELGMAHFSFNKPDGACPTCTGLGSIHSANLNQLIDLERSLLQNGVLTWDAFNTERYIEILIKTSKYYGFEFNPELPIKKFPRFLRDLLLYGVSSPQFRQHFPGKHPPATVREGYFEGVVTNLLRRYSEKGDDSAAREKMEKQLHHEICPDCQGTRLKAESRAVTVNRLSIVDLSDYSLTRVAEWIDQLPIQVSGEAWAVIEPIVADLHERIRRLVAIGVGYLTLNRATPTLSAGEAQRLRLAALLGSGLTGVLYVLDEPTTGLHQRDTQRLISALKQLRDLGNTVLVIEHDLEMVKAADYVVDFGPGAGLLGGQVVGAGKPEDLASFPDSTTGRFLSGQENVPVPTRRRQPNGKRLSILGARANNLKNVNLDLPLGLLVAVSGVSGSGKSTLMLDILDKAARNHFYGASELAGEHDSILGWHYLEQVITIDQTPIGRVPRSNAATYTDAFTPIRETFAQTALARQRGLTSRHFSFNVPGGRCERCEGAGVLTVEMHFLPDVQVRCPVCHGRRFKSEVLNVQYNGANIADVLNMTIEEACQLFKRVPATAARLELMVDVGLGYLQLGQPATTLSGGEAQRVKLAKEISRRTNGRTLYLLDEPTTGLHPADVAHLLLILQRLVDAGNSVVVIEHNIDVIRAADWVIDLGPEGGEAGGVIIASGPPEQIAQAANSYTGLCL